MDPKFEPDAWTFLKRAMNLRCPECGKSRLFIPWRKIRRLRQWMHPVDGCAHCGYDYEREPGYFLLSIWAINFGVIGAFGVGSLFLMDSLFHLPLWITLLTIGPVIPILNLLFVRHAKSLFLAMDHYFDPHVTKPISALEQEPKGSRRG